MKRLLIAALLALCAPAAFATDLLGLKDGSAVTSSSPWAGTYIGVNAGFSWENDVSVTGVTNGKGTMPLQSSAKPSGAVGGVMLGYNWQVTPWLVVGPELDLQMANILRNSTITLGGVAIGDQNSSIDWYGTARLRAGVPLLDNKLLVFATGGLAYGGVSNRATSLMFVLADDTTRVGWVAGVGFDAQLYQNLWARMEWQHIDLGSDALTGAGLSTNQVHNNLDVIRAGLVLRLH